MDMNIDKSQATTPFFCTFCGTQSIVIKVPADDNRPRKLCLQCNHVFYENPKVVVGAVVTFDDRYLLCKRAIEPRLGFWTYPAGFMENGETLEAGAKRETKEETQADVTLVKLLGTYSLTSVNQVHVIYSAKMNSSHFGVTPESSEVKLFDETNIPWDDLAFSVIHVALKAHIADQKGLLAAVDSQEVAQNL